MSNKATQKFAAKGSKSVKNSVAKASVSKTESKSTNKVNKSNNKSRIQSVRQRFLKGGWIWVLGIVSVIIILSFSARTSGEYSRLNLFEIELDGASSVQTATDFIKQNLSELSAEQVAVVGGNKITFRAISSSEYITTFSEKFAGNSAVLGSRAYQVSPSLAFDQEITNFAIGMGLYLAGSAITTLLFMRKSSMMERAKVAVALTGLPLLSGLTLAAIGIVLSQLGLVTYNPHTYDLLAAGVAAVIMVTLFMVFYPETRRKLFEYIY